jgi:hypothetical protein
MEDNFKDFLKFLTLFILLFLPFGIGVLFLHDGFFSPAPIFVWVAWVVFVNVFLADSLLKIKQ